MDSARPPRKHHFAPAFHLTEWTGADGELEQFHRPYGPEVKVRRLPPTATGFRENLYVMPGLPPHLEQQVESRFMQHVDDLAAVELARMKAGGLPSTSEQRSAWTRYMQSLLLRTPADIAGIKARTRIDWGVTIPKIQETYESLKRIGDPATFEEFVTKDDPQMVERVAMKLATVLIDNPGMGAFINNMKWDVLEVSGADHALLTSDLGPEQIFGLGDSRAFITLPLTPHPAVHRGQSSRQHRQSAPSLAAPACPGPQRQRGQDGAGLCLGRRSQPGDLHLPTFRHGPGAATRRASRRHGGRCLTVQSPLDRR